MAHPTFDILFAGEITEAADPERVRHQLQQRFMLSDKAAAQLFGGGTFALKRGVDIATAVRYQEVFRDSGAVVHVRQAASSNSPQDLPAVERAAPPAPAEREGPSETELEKLRLQAEARQSETTKPQFAAQPPAIDISYLSLVPGDDWTLEDCQPPVVSAKLPDTSHLKLVATVPDRVEES